MSWSFSVKFLTDTTASLEVSAILKHFYSHKKVNSFVLNKSDLEGATLEYYPEVMFARSCVTPTNEFLQIQQNNLISDISRTVSRHMQ